MPKLCVPAQGALPMRAQRLRIVPAQGQHGSGWAGARFLLPPQWGGFAHDGQAIELYFSRTRGWSMRGTGDGTA